MRLNDGGLAHRLHSTISQTYGLFLGRYVEVTLNGNRVEPFKIPIGASKECIPPVNNSRKVRLLFNCSRALPQETKRVSGKQSVRVGTLSVMGA